METKHTWMLPLGIAFVGFTTQFGGGFASGAQLYSYFINCGIWGLFTPLLAQAVFSLFYWYGMKWAFRFKTYDYRSFSDAFYGKYRVIFSNLYELCYVCMLCLAPAVAFATGGSTLSKLTGLPYMPCTLIIGAFIFVVTIFGTDLVRRCSSVLSVVIIAGLLVVIVPNIIAQWGTIVSGIHTMLAGRVPAVSPYSGSFGSSLWRGLLYGIFQTTAIGLMYQHVQPVREEKQIGRAMWYLFLVDVLVMYLAIFGMLAISFHPELANYDVPMLLLVQSGVGAKVLTPVISLLIILGAISTGVNMIAGMVSRIVNRWEKNKAEKKTGHLTRNLVVSIAFTALAWGIAQLGLIPLVSKGYSYVGYLTLVVIIIPFIMHFAAHCGKASVGQK